ncbi:Putative acyl-CoA-binding protein [Toxocara canis]|uniref:Putative acyl-CoA-binding protein n=2 Tax=Toxocara canis TaxID=6265 RepID=A0A0B2VLK6_TOXCA|nr:Putative acyl-CoA-binding protein [Toxocara canis]VDM45289.1 unnamed protein product [Toxocara canis]
MTFEEAADKVKKLKKTPTDDEKLQVYALYKQATVGDINTEKPGVTDVKGRAKWSAWEGKKGTSKDKAKEEYVKLVDGLVAKYGI